MGRQLPRSRYQAVKRYKDQWQEKDVTLVFYQVGRAKQVRSQRNRNRRGG